MSFALALTVALLAPPTLGDGLRAIGAAPCPPVPKAEEQESSWETNTSVSICADHPGLSAQPLPSPRFQTYTLLGVAGAATLTGLVGTVVSAGCATRAADGRCVDVQGSMAVFPALLVLGLGGLATGAYWLRQDHPPTDP